MEELHKKIQGENQKIADQLEVLRKKMFELIQDAYDKAADLGVNLPKDFNNGYDELTDYIAKVPLSNKGNIFPI